MERIFRRGLAAFRWGALAWLIVAIVISSSDAYLRHVPVVVLLVGLAAVFTIADSVLASRGASVRMRRLIASAEFLTGLAMMTLDGFVREDLQVFETGPTLGSWWPVIGLLTVATYVPRALAFIYGLLFGVARTISVALNGYSLDGLTTAQWLSLVNTGFFAGLAALTANGLVRLLRRAESEVALARARDEFSRTLHDGVLQTLALVERRSDDADLVAIVRAQEREVREMLNDRRKPAAESNLRSSLDSIVASFESHHAGTGKVIVAPDLPELSREVTAALVGATTEAVNNSVKHGRATEVTIYVEPHDEAGVVCSITDNGAGFVIGDETRGFGIENSMNARLEEVGGTVSIKSTPGIGTEVVLWAP